MSLSKRLKRSLDDHNVLTFKKVQSNYYGSVSKHFLRPEFEVFQGELLLFLIIMTFNLMPFSDLS